MTRPRQLERAFPDPVTAGPAQRGFTLVELVAAIALSALIGGVMVNSIFELNTASASGRAWQSVTVNVRTATIWLERDVTRALSTDVPDGGGPVAAAQFDWEDESGPHSCDYALSGDDLVRTCDGTPGTVASNIAGLQFSRSGQLLTVGFTVTAPARPSINESVSMHLAMRSN